MPGASSLPLPIQIAIWLLLITIGVLSGMCVFWVKRFFDENDKKFSDLFNKFSSVAKDMKEMSLNFDLSLKSMRSKMDDDFKAMGLHISEFRKHLGEVNIQLVSFGKDYKSTAEDVEKISAILEKHKEQIGKITTVVVRHDEKIKTVIERINDDLLMIKQKKQ